MRFDAIIVGGGVSGLSTAYDLSRRGHRVVVLESQVWVGGCAVSEPVAGFLMEHGPSSVNGSGDATRALANAVGLGAEIVRLGPGARRRYLVKDGALRGLGAHPLAFLTSSYLGLGARLRMAAEIGVPAGDPGREETVAAFFRRRFGAALAEQVAEPLVAGMFAADADRVSMPATFPRLVEMERRHGSIIRALLHGRARGGRMPARRLFSWRRGLGALPGALARRLGPAVRTGIAVRRVVPSPAGFRVDAGAAGVLEARVVVVATQPHAAAALLERLDGESAAAAAAIEAPPLAVVFLGYRRAQVDHPLDGIGYLTPKGEGRGLTAALFCSTMFAGRAPAGHVALAGYLGGARAPDVARLAPEELIEIARAEFSELLGARGEPVLARVRQWSRGLPQYGLGHGARVAVFEGLAARRPGAFLTGNYLAGPGIASCIAQAMKTSLRADRFLRGDLAPARVSLAV